MHRLMWIFTTQWILTRFGTVAQMCNLFSWPALPWIIMAKLRYQNQTENSRENYSCLCQTIPQFLSKQRLFIFQWHACLCNKVDNFYQQTFLLITKLSFYWASTAICLSADEIIKLHMQQGSNKGQTRVCGIYHYVVRTWEPKVLVKNL